MGFFIALFQLALLILLWKWLQSLPTFPFWPPMVGLTALLALLLIWQWLSPGWLVFYLLLSTLVAWLWLAWEYPGWGRGLVWLVQVACLLLAMWYELAPYPVWQRIETGEHWASLPVFGLLPAVGLLVVVRLGQALVFPPQPAALPPRWRLPRLLYLPIILLTLWFRLLRPRAQNRE